jgi:hypothetical protein
VSKNILHKIYLVLLLGLFTCTSVIAQQNIPSTISTNSPENSEEEEIVEYLASFFQRYSPNTAYDMIQQLPGFQLDDGDASRGLGAAAGNVLINDRRPSAKQDLPSVILTRIPASLVERIELIRGQVRDIDLQGQSVIANIILRDDSDSPAAISWDATWRYNLTLKSTYEGGISISDKWNDIDYNAGLEMRYLTRGDHTFQNTFDSDDVFSEKRNDEFFANGIRGSANLNTASWIAENFVKFNTTITWEDRQGLRQATRIPQPQGGGFREEFIADDFKLRSFEVGGDVERKLTPDLQGTAIVLLIRSKEDTFTSLRRTALHHFQDNVRRTFLRIADADARSTEGIARLEFDWTGISDHTIQANLEGAFNSLDGGLIQTEDTGAGAIDIDVLGANTLVEEVRWDFLLKDTWTLGNFEMDYGLGAEISTISQTGDAELERSFTFLKPQGVLTYTTNQGQQTKLRISREVSQLNFEDFVSGNVFEDDEVALGNSELQPDATWIAEVIHERRFGPQSVLKLSAFHHWISNTLDFLPLSDTLDTVGNIGKGKRWGVEIESTIPLERVGLVGARLDIIARWQDSSVVDPVTGENRVISDRTPPMRLMPLGFRSENNFAVAIDYRQDFQTQQVAWGWDIRSRGDRPRFRVDELDVIDEGTEFNAFVETTRWFGLKMTLDVQNILDLKDSRDRIRFVGERDLTHVGFREHRDRLRSIRVAFSVSGSF